MTLPVPKIDVAPGSGADLSRARLAAIIQSSDDAIVSKDFNGVITTWNNSAERIFGYTAEEVIGQHISLIIPKDRFEEENHIISSIRAGRRVDHFETVRLTKSGKLVNLSITVSPIRDESGQIVGASKVARDITERIEIEQALREGERRKDEFLAILAHELRNPLAPLRNALAIFRSDKASESIKAQAREMMERQINQMVRLVDDLMDVSRITRDKIALQKERITLEALLHNAVETSRPVIDSFGHYLKIDLPSDPVYIDGDMVRLSQVFANLLNNAAKYTRRGGKISVSGRKEGDNVVIHVIDNGIGISPKMMPRVFDMFLQVDSTIERSQSGLGIGLTLVKKLVEMHGGVVEAFSEGENKGSDFVVTLPASSAQVSEESNDKSKPEEKSAGTRVLVIDDNVDSARTLGWMLELQGHDVQLAFNGKDAMAAAEKFQPRIVMTDIGLPGITGYELCPLMREIPGMKDAVFIAQTGWGQEKHKRQSKEAGFDHHLIKPVEMNKLEELLSSILNPEKIN
jgi:PAS domain S-box-containing protein